MGTNELSRPCLPVFLVAVISMLLCSCASIRPLQTVESVRAFDYDGMILAGQPDRGLALAITKSEAGDSAIDVMLKNEGDRRLCVNSRFVVDCGQYDASPTLFITMERASNGEKVPLAKKSWTQGGRGSEARWFKYLEAHEYHKSSVNLREFFDLEKGEQYRVTVEYDNQESGYDKGGWVEMYAWVGRIKSNKLLLK